MGIINKVLNCSNKFDTLVFNACAESGPKKILAFVGGSDLFVLALVIVTLMIGVFGLLNILGSAGIVAFPGSSLGVGIFCVVISIVSSMGTGAIFLLFTKSIIHSLRNYKSITDYRRIDALGLKDF